MVAPAARELWYAPPRLRAASFANGSNMPQLVLRSVGFACVGLVAALGIRLLYLLVTYFSGSTTQRHHVESTAFIFIALGLGWRLAHARDTKPIPGGRALLPVAMLPVFCALAVALYWPALWIGLLSDDYVLASHAAQWAVGPVTPELFRPAALFAWALILEVGLGATALHLFSLLLHGTNAYLAACLVSGWGHTPTWSTLAGLLVVTAPLSVEAVAWCAGVFDPLATSLVILSILAARHAESHPTIATRGLVIALGIAAVASKETAAIGAVLILVDAWARRTISRRLMIDLGVLAAVIGVYSVARLVSAGAAAPVLSRYLVQRVVFGAFGSLAAPWHVEVARGVPLLPMLSGAIIVVLLGAFFIRPGSRQSPRRAAASVAWIVTSILPVWTAFYVGPTLEGTRYLTCRAWDGPR